MVQQIRGNVPREQDNICDDYRWLQQYDSDGRNVVGYRAHVVLAKLGQHPALDLGLLCLSTQPDPGLVVLGPQDCDLPNWIHWCILHQRNAFHEQSCRGCHVRYVRWQRAVLAQDHALVVVANAGNSFRWAGFDAS